MSTCGEAGSDVHITVKELAIRRVEYRSGIYSTESQHLANGTEVARLHVFGGDSRLFYSTYFHPARVIISADRGWGLRAPGSSVRKARCLYTRIVPRRYPGPRGRKENGAGGGIGGRNGDGDGEGNGDENGDGDGDKDRAGTRTWVEANEGTRDGNGDGSGDGDVNRVKTRGRTQGEDGGGRGDGNESSRGYENGDKDGDGNEDGVGEGGGEAKKRKKPQEL